MAWLNFIHCAVEEGVRNHIQATSEKMETIICSKKATEKARVGNPMMRERGGVSKDFFDTILHFFNDKDRFIFN